MKPSSVRGVIEAQFDFSNFFKLQNLRLTTLRPLAKEENSEAVSTFERFRNSHLIVEAHNPITTIPFFVCLSGTFDNKNILSCSNSHINSQKGIRHNNISF